MIGKAFCYYSEASARRVSPSPVNTFGLSLCEISVKVSLLALSGDDSNHLVALVDSALVLTEASAGHLDGALLLLGNTTADVFDHLALVGGETGDLVDDLADGLDSGVEFALAVGLGLLERVVADSGLSDDEAFVEANEQSSLLLHLISLK